MIDGGAGDDEVDYSASTAPVDIDLERSGPQNGGSLGRDTLTSIEEIEGSDLNDVLRGNGRREHHLGLDGERRHRGAGRRRLPRRGRRDGHRLLRERRGAGRGRSGRSPTPQVTGGAGAGSSSSTPFENLIGGAGTDVLRGTVGPNIIEGRAGLDRILALEGDDAVLVRDGIPDTVDCGPGNDRASVDPGGIDVTIGCESVAVGVAVGSRAPRGRGHGRVRLAGAPAGRRPA